MSIVPIDVSASSSVSCPSPPLSLPASSSVSAPPSSHIHGKRARKKVNSVREGKSSPVPTLQTMTEEKWKSASEKTPLTDEFAVPVVKSSGDERKSLFFPASSSSTQNSEFQSDVSSSVKPHQMAVRSDVGGFLRAELLSNAGAKELRTSPPLNQIGTALQAQKSRTARLYLTLVRDGALPSGFQQEFETLASAIETKNTALANKSQRAREAACQHQEQQVAIPSQTVGPHRKTLGREVEFTWWQKSGSGKNHRKRSA